MISFHFTFFLRLSFFEQLETTAFLRQVGSCVIGFRTCFSGPSLDYMVVNKNFRHCVRNVWADKRAPWSAHVHMAFDVMRKPSKNRTWQMVSPSPLVPQAPQRRNECG